MSIETGKKVTKSTSILDIRIVKLDLNRLNLSKKDVLELENEVLSNIIHEKYYSVIEVKDYLKLASDVKEYLISEERSWRVAAEAILTRSFTQKLMVDLYFQFNLPLVPTKTFTHSTEAINWFESLK